MTYGNPNEYECGNVLARRLLLYFAHIKTIEKFEKIVGHRIENARVYINSQYPDILKEIKNLTKNQ